MTLILRSDARAKNHLGGSHGYDGPLDYVAMLDFAGGDYFRMSGGSRVDMSLSEVVSVSRSSVGAVRRRDGSIAEVPANRPRISYIPEYGMSGLLIERSLTNHVTSPSNGSTVNIGTGNTSTFAVLSYKGGSASLSHASLALVDSYVVSGRNVKVYSRSSSSVIPATLSNSGASEVQVVSSASVSLGMYAGNFVGYGGVQGVETATLGSAFAALISAGNFSIVQQVCLNPTGNEDGRNNLWATSVRSGVPHGGAYTSFPPRKGISQSAFAATIADGGPATPSTHNAVTGTWRDQAVMGLTCAGNGDSVGVLAFGQYAKADGLGSQFGVPTTIHLGGDPSVGIPNARIGGIITRVAIYNRMLTDDEAWAVANTWR